MKLAHQYINTGSYLREGKVVGFTYHCLEFEGDREEMQKIWDYVCLLNKGDSGREPVANDPASTWTRTKFSFTDKGTAAMVKLAFA